MRSGAASGSGLPRRSGDGRVWASFRIAPGQGVPPIVPRLALGRALAAAGVTAAPAPAWAQSCSVTAASGSYGTVDVLPGAAVDSSTTFSVSCSGKKNDTVRLCIEMGRGASAPGPSGERALTSGATDYLDHEFYTDAARSLIWGSWGSVVTVYPPGGVTSDLPLGSTGSANRTFTLYARILAGQQTKPPATYTWTGSSPGMRYGYLAAALCPTGGATVTSPGSTWTAVVASNCLVSATGINFGSAGTLAANVDSTGTLSVQCTSTVPYIVALNGGNAAATDPTQRKMSKGAERITYGLYRDVARTLAWGSTGGVNTAAGTGTGLAQSLTVHGRIPPQTTPSTGVYSDTIVVTVTY